MLAAFAALTGLVTVVTATVVFVAVNVAVDLLPAASVAVTVNVIVPSFKLLRLMLLADHDVPVTVAVTAEVVWRCRHRWPRW